MFWEELRLHVPFWRRTKRENKHEASKMMSKRKGVLPESESSQGKPQVQLFLAVLSTEFSETSCWVVEVADSSILCEVSSSSFLCHSLFLCFLLIETCLLEESPGDSKRMMSMMARGSPKISQQQEEQYETHGLTVREDVQRDVQRTQHVLCLCQFKRFTRHEDYLDSFNDLKFNMLSGIVNYFACTNVSQGFSHIVISLSHLYCINSLALEKKWTHKSIGFVLWNSEYVFICLRQRHKTRQLSMLYHSNQEKGRPRSFATKRTVMGITQLIKQEQLKTGSEGSTSNILLISWSL